MTAIHIRTSELRSEWSVEIARKAAASVAGVARVAAARSLGLVSVMFDETRASAEQIVSALRRAGFDASVYHPGS